MYTMKQVCQQTGLSYETLKFYCNQGLVPHVKRDENNRRIFDDRDVAWLNSLHCLKDCGMSLSEMREYIQLCLEGESTIPQRKVILEGKRRALVAQLEQVKGCIAYIDWKQTYYDEVLAGTRVYESRLTGEQSAGQETPSHA